MSSRYLLPVTAGFGFGRLLSGRLSLPAERVGSTLIRRRLVPGSWSMDYLPGTTIEEYPGPLLTLEAPSPGP